MFTGAFVPVTDDRSESNWPAEPCSVVDPRIVVVVAVGKVRVCAAVTVLVRLSGR